MKKLLALSCLAFSAFATQAEAAPIIVGTYYEETASTLCQFASSCTLAFSAAPAGRRIINRGLTCEISFQGGDLTSFRLQLGGSRVVFPKATALPKVGATPVYNITDSTPFGVAGVAPTLFAGGSITDTSVQAEVFIYCTIIGELVAR